MGNRTHGQFSCPIEGCPAILCSINNVAQHLRNKHGFTARETWPYRDSLKEKGEDWDKFKANFEKLEAGTL